MGQRGIVQGTTGWYLIASHGDMVVRVRPGMPIGETATGELSFDPACAQLELDISEDGDLVVSAVDDHELESVGGTRRRRESLARHRRAEIRLPHNVLRLDTDFVDPAQAATETVELRAIRPSEDGSESQLVAEPQIEAPPDPAPDDSADPLVPARPPQRNVYRPARRRGLPAADAALEPSGGIPLPRRAPGPVREEPTVGKAPVRPDPERTETPEQDDPPDRVWPGGDELPDRVWPAQAELPNRAPRPERSDLSERVARPESHRRTHAHGQRTFSPLMMAAAAIALVAIGITAFYPRESSAPELPVRTGTSATEEGIPPLRSDLADGAGQDAATQPSVSALPAPSRDVPVEESRGIEADQSEALAQQRAATTSKPADEGSARVSDVPAQESDERVPAQAEELATRRPERQDRQPARSDAPSERSSAQTAVRQPEPEPAAAPPIELVLVPSIERRSMPEPPVAASGPSAAENAPEPIETRPDPALVAELERVDVSARAAAAALSLQRDLQAADLALAQGRLTSPPEDSAYTLYSRVLSRSPGSEQATKGLNAVRQGLVNRALAQLAGNALDDARRTLQGAEEAGANPLLVSDLRGEVEYRQRLTDARAGQFDSLYPADQLVPVSQEPPRLRRSPSDGEAVSVEVQFTVTENGDVSDVAVLGNPPQSLEEAVGRAVEKWRFKPVLYNGRPLPVRSSVRFDFGN